MTHVTKSIIQQQKKKEKKPQQTHQQIKQHVWLMAVIVQLFGQGDEFSQNTLSGIFYYYYFKPFQHFYKKINPSG